MNIRKITLVGALALLAAGCQPTNDQAILGDPLFVEREESQEVRDTDVDMTEAQQIEQEDLAELFNQMVGWYNQLEAVETELKQTITWSDGTVYERHQESDERYHDQMIDQFKTKQQTDSSMSEIYYDGESQYFKTGYDRWDEVGGAKSPITVIDWVRWFAEGDHTLSLEEGFSHPILRVELTDPSQTDLLIQTLDLPYMISPLTTVSGTIDYEVDESNGQIVKLTANIDLHENDETHQVALTATTHEIEEAESLEVDLDATSEFPNEDEFDRIKRANAIDAVTFYTMQAVESVGDDSMQTLHYVNTKDSKLYRAIEATLSEEGEIEEGNYYTPTTYYHLVDDKVQVDDQEAINWYQQFIERFVDQSQAGELSAVESDESIMYREVYQGDFDSLQAELAPYNIANINPEQEAVYAIDYQFDPETYRLTAVYLWSLTEDEEEIERINVLSFGQFNGYDPNLLREFVPESIWDEAFNH